MHYLADLSLRGGGGHEVLTAGNVDEVLAGCLVHLDVAVADVVLVPLECHVAVLGCDKANQCFAVPATLGAETQCHTTSVEDTKPGLIKKQMVVLYATTQPVRSSKQVVMQLLFSIRADLYI